VEESNVSLYVALSSSSPSCSSAALTTKPPATFPLEAVALLFVLLGKTPPNIRPRVVVIEDDDDDDVPMSGVGGVAFVVIIISKE
jgi:hypothetical protein